MAKLSTQTAHRRSITETVTSSLDSHRETLIAALTGALFPAGVPADFDLGRFIDGLSQHLRRCYQTVEARDVGLAQERSEDRTWRVLRDQHTGPLRAQMSELRDIMGLAFGPEVVRACGLTGSLPEIPDALILACRNTVAAVRTGLPTPRPVFANIDFAAMVTDIEAKADALDQAVSTLATELRETEDALIARDQAVEAWTRAYVPVAGLAEHLFALGGLSEHAARVRPTARRRVGLPEAADAPAAEPGDRPAATEPAAVAPAD